MTVVVVPFLYVGTLISKNFAALLEEHDIFVPEDDDDDDWTTFENVYGKVFFSLILLTASLDLILHLFGIFPLPIKGRVFEGHKCSGKMKGMQYYEMFPRFTQVFGVSPFTGGV